MAIVPNVTNGNALDRSDDDTLESACGNVESVRLEMKWATNGSPPNRPSGVIEFRNVPANNNRIDSRNRMWISSTPKNRCQTTDHIKRVKQPHSTVNATYLGADPKSTRANSR